MSTPRVTLADRLTDGLLVSIVLSVGLMAGAASFNHVHDWTMHNSPAGTAGWFGWANAVITELIPTAALIIIARRRRHGGRIAYPMFLLIVAIGLSLTAQLAVARPTVFGWMVSALPAAAFFALSKLVFTATRPAPSAVDPAPAGVAVVEELHRLATRVHHLETRPTEPVSALTPAGGASPATPRGNAADPSTLPGRQQDHGPHIQSPTHPASRTTPATATPTQTPVSTVDNAASVLPVAQPTVSTKLLPQARIIAQAHHATHGVRITPGQLAVRMRVGTDIAERILDALTEIPTAANTTRHNGTPTTGVPA